MYIRPEIDCVSLLDSRWFTCDLPTTNGVRQSSQYRRLEIRVMEAGGLAKADRFGLSDPYVVIRANGQTQVRSGCCTGIRKGFKMNPNALYTATTLARVSRVCRNL